MVWRTKVASHQWVCSKVRDAEHESDETLTLGCLSSVHIRQLSKTTRRDSQWSSVAAAQNNSGNEDLMPAWIFLLEYRDVRYGIVDSVVLAAVSCLSVVSGLTVSSAQCRGWSFVVLLLMTLQLVSLVTAHVA